MQQLLDTYHELLANLGTVYQRQIYASFATNMRVVGIVGARGVGKTTFLLEYLRQNYPHSNKAVYISADAIFFSQTSLFDFAQWFVRTHAGEVICIDEIHRYPKWAQELKNIYDTFPHLRIYFSGSSSINLIKQTYDLSRRAVLKHLPGFSFREYLEHTLHETYPKLELPQLVNDQKELYEKAAQTPKLLGHFQDYLQTGYYPFAKEIDNTVEFHETLMNVVDKIIEADIASYYTLKTSTLPVFKKILYFVATTPPSEFNIGRLAKSLGKDFTDVSSYVDMMMETGLLRYLLHDKQGHALIRNAHKVFLNNSNLAQAVARSIGQKIDVGSLRELFVVSNLQNAKHIPFHPQQGDVSVDGYTFEIGGKNKGGSQMTGFENSFIVKDDVLYGDQKVIPLYLFGFLY